MKKLKRSNLKRYWCFQAQNPGVLTTKAASEVGEGWGVEEDEGNKEAGQGRQQKCPRLIQHPQTSTWSHSRCPVSTHFISVSGSAPFPGLAKPTQSQLAAVVLTPLTITSMGQGQTGYVRGNGVAFQARITPAPILVRTTQGEKHLRCQYEMAGAVRSRFMDNFLLKMHLQEVNIETDVEFSVLIQC